MFNLCLDLDSIRAGGGDLTGANGDLISTSDLTIGVLIVKANVDPSPMVLVALISPPIIKHNSRQIANPSPLPLSKKAHITNRNGK